MHSIRHGQGKPLLLVHGLGSSWNAWRTILNPLGRARSVIAIDLPGHGRTPAQADSGTFAGLARSLDDYIVAQGLTGIDVVGSSLGGRLVLEMARRGRVGHVVSLDPGGFWQGWERDYVRTTLSASVRLLRLLRPALPMLAHNAASRTALLAQLSARAWALNGDLVQTECETLAGTATVLPLIEDLAEGPVQRGRSVPGRVAIGWGRQDRLLSPAQAYRAQAAFPGSILQWFEGSGHFPMWDRPREAVALILRTTA